MKWNARNVSRTRQELDAKILKLNCLQYHDKPEITSINGLGIEIDSWLDKEDFKWKQQAKNNWFKCGDKNTKFSHAHTSQHRHCNRILSIVDAHEGAVSCPKKIVAIFLNYSEDMFQSSYPSARVIEACTSSIKKLSQLL